ncbi:Uncharacterised protein [Yersinia mollaretii]|nr:Uncharacterised protein [Yersinia mollaretii]
MEWREQRRITSERSLAKLAEEHAVQEQIDRSKQSLAQLESDILANKENVKRWTEEINKSKGNEESDIQSAVQFTTDFYQTLTEK